MSKYETEQGMTQLLLESRLGELNREQLVKIISAVFGKFDLKKYIAKQYITATPFKKQLIEDSLKKVSSKSIKSDIIS